MDRIFPLAFPFPTAFYLSLYVLTLVLHVVLMSYVAGGTLLLAVAACRRRPPDAIVTVLRDWMPAGVSGAITFGVAPLLFLQILYREAYYTANLLLFHRWMSVLPVLIVAFYLTYLLKTKATDEWTRVPRAALGVSTYLCFVFIALSWTENHLLSVQSQEIKTALYLSGSMRFAGPNLWPRLMLWLAGALPVMCLLVAWQLHGRGTTRNNVFLARWALAGFAGSVLSGVYYYLQLPEGAAVAWGPMSWPYTTMALIGAAAGCGTWIRIAHTGHSRTWLLVLGSVATVVMLLGATVLREVLRLQKIDLTAFYEQHAAAMRIGGFWVFILFAGLNVAAIFWCIHLVQRVHPLRRFGAGSENTGKTDPDGITEP